MKLRSLTSSVILCMVFGFLFSVTAYGDGGKIPVPEEFLGYKLGKTMTRWQKIYDYMWNLDKNSPRVKTVSIGKSYRGQDMIVVLFSSPQNIKKLEKFTDISNKIHDPRTTTMDDMKKMCKEGKVFFLVEMGMHSNELGNVEASIPLAYKLATAEGVVSKSLEDVILVLNPCQHPDGYDDMVDWYDKYRDEIYWIIPPYYGDFVSHDDNRCLMRLKPKHIETSMVPHLKYKPQVVWNMHQGPPGELVFNLIPAEPDVIYPTVDWATVLPGYMIVCGVYTDMLNNGFKNMMWLSGGGYSPWYIGCADTMPMYHNSVSGCWEVGGRKFPETGWGATYTEKIVVNSLNHIAKQKEMLLNNRYQIGKRAIDRGRKKTPYAWLVPKMEQKDPAVAAEMINTLLGLGIEIHELQESIMIKDRKFKSGTYVIRLDQPFGGLAQACMEKQNFRVTKQKSSPKPTGWTFPLLMGVKSFRIDDPAVLLFRCDKISRAFIPKGKVMDPDATEFFLLENRMNNSVVAINWLLRDNHHVYQSVSLIKCRGREFPRGSFVVKAGKERLGKIAHQLGINFYGIEKLDKSKIKRLGLSRLALYHGWMDNRDEGWTRMVLKDHDFSFQRISNKDIRLGSLKENCDVIILPSMRYQSLVKGRKFYPAGKSGGIGSEGIKNLKEFVADGGHLITIDQSVHLIASHFDIGVIIEKKNPHEFQCSGSVVAAKICAVNHPVRYGFSKQPEISLFFRNSPLINLNNPKGEVIVRFADKNVEQSGYVVGEQNLYNRPSVVQIFLGKGKVTIFAHSLIGRYQTQGTFLLLFNTILSSGIR